MEKRGQITIFILIGIMIVFGVGIAIFLSTKGAEITKEEIPEVYAKDYEAIDFYIRSCLKGVAEEGFSRMGVLGGAIEPGWTDKLHFQMNPYRATDQFRYLFRADDQFIASASFPFYSTDIHSYLSDTYRIKVTGYILNGLGIADCVIANRPDEICTPAYIPSMYEVEGFWECIDNFKPFRDQGWSFEYDHSGAEVEIYFLKDRTDVKMQFPVRMKKLDQNYKIDEFIVSTYSFSDSTLDLIATELEGVSNYLITYMIPSLVSQGVVVTQPSDFINIDWSTIPPLEPADLSSYDPSLSGGEADLPNLMIRLEDDPFILPDGQNDYTHWWIHDDSTSPKPYYFYFITSLN